MCSACCARFLSQGGILPLNHPHPRPSLLVVVSWTSPTILAMPQYHACHHHHRRETIKDAMEPSRYATSELPPFISKAANTLNDRVRNGGLPAVSRFGIWSAVVSHVLERFVEGYSRVKKCTVPGRGLMSLDAGTIYALCVKSGPVQPQCLGRDKTFIDGYVSAFYFDNESDLLEWISKNRPIYALHHVRGLLNNGIGPNLKKKNLKDVQTAIDSLYVVPLPEDLSKHAERAADMTMKGLTAMGGAMLGNSV